MRCPIGAGRTSTGSSASGTVSGARAWYRHWLTEAAALREDYGAVVGVPGSEIALAPNVSTALTTIASATDALHRGDGGRRARTRVITTALDFPSIGHQWLARAPLGVEVVTLPSPDGLTVPLEAFEQAIDERTALVATSHVYFTTGAVQDLAGLAALAHDAGALLVVDAYQATGLVPTRLGAADGPDAYVSGTLKWLFGGPGNAFLWVRPELWPELTPTTTGWFSSARQFAFDGTSLEFAPDARRYELGTPGDAEHVHRPRRARDRPGDRRRAAARADDRSGRARDRDSPMRPGCECARCATTSGAAASSQSRWPSPSPSWMGWPIGGSSSTTGRASCGSRPRSTTPRTRCGPSWTPSRTSCRHATGSDCNGIGATPSLMGDTTHWRTDADRGDPPGP